MNANHMSMMKTSLMINLMCPRERFPLYKSLSRLILCYKKDWAILLHLIYFYTCYSLQITLSQNYLLPIISMLAENTLLKTSYHFLLLLVGFDTLTYRKATIDLLYLWASHGCHDVELVAATSITRW